MLRRTSHDCVARRPAKSGSTTQLQLAEDAELVRHEEEVGEMLFSTGFEIIKWLVCLNLPPRPRPVLGSINVGSCACQMPAAQPPDDISGFLIGSHIIFRSDITWVPIAEGLCRVT